MLATSNKAFGTITRRKSSNKINKEIDYLQKKDKRMRFNNSKDPIYFVFDCIENRPVTTLAKEFVKDSFKDIASYISKVVG